MTNEEKALSAQVNFENLERAMPLINKHPFYRIAKAQLDESLGGQPFHKKLESLKSLDVKSTTPIETETALTPFQALKKGIKGMAG